MTTCMMPQILGGMSEGEHTAFVMGCHNTTEVAYTLEPVSFQGSTQNLPPFMYRGGYGGDFGAGEPMYGHVIQLQIRMTSPVGTNPTMGYKCTYRVLEAI